MNNLTQITNFLKYLSLHGVSLKSLKYYKSDLVNFLNWSGDRKVTTTLIQEYISSIRPITPTSTLNRRISTLRSYGSFMGFKKPTKSWQDAIISKFEHKPKVQNLLNKLFFNRPDWYRKYHSYPLATYIHIAILVLFTSVAGYALYDQVFRNPTNPLAFPTALTRPNRYLSFQGRLTDNLGNPKTVATDMVFQLYSVSSGGSALWNSGTCSITPDSDGIFSTLLGSSCGAEIAATVFSENSSIWLGATMGADAEATPRVQIATVAYALNAETLQGYPAGTGTSTIPYINSSGNVVLANASPKIQSTSGTFAVEGVAMTLTTPNTSNGIITINPDGVGTLNLTFEGTAAGLSANGFVNATNANITSGSLYGGTVASAATGYNFIDFQSGVSPTSKFSVSSTGAITTASGLTIGTTSLSETTSPTDSGGYLIGVNDEFANSANTNVQAVLNDLDAAISGGTYTSWTLAGDTGSNQTISNSDAANILGGTNGIDTVGSLTDTLTINLDTTEIGTTTFGVGAGITWTFDASAGTDTTLAFSNNTITATTGTFELSNNLKVSGNQILNSAGTASILFSATPTTTANTLSAGNWLIENTANVGQAALIVNQAKSGDLFTASASGTPKFTITNSGIVKSHVIGGSKANLDIMELTNQYNAADMDTTRTSILFNQWYYDATTPAIADAGRLTVGAETDWTSTASTQDAFLSFDTALNGTLAEKMRITSAGNVGIGTTAPSQMLHLKAPSSPNEAIIRLEKNDAAYYADIKVDGNTDFSISNANSKTLLYGTWSGLVGIGTVSPGALLHISGSSIEQLRLTPTTSGSTGISMYDNGGSASARGWGIQTNSGTWGNFVLFESASAGANPFSGTARVTVLSGGNVGIGVNPSYKLEIACASTTWSDRGSSISCSDYAEVYEHSENRTDLEQGQILIFDSNNDNKVKISTSAYDNKISGVLSDSPGMLIGAGNSVALGGIDPSNLDDHHLPMALVGKVLTKVSLINGTIQPGDPITSSPIKGTGMKAIRAGTIVGKAMESLNESSTLTDCINPETGVTEKCGLIVVFVNVNYFDPELILANNGDLTVNGDSITNYTVSNPDGIIDKISAFANATIAKLKVGIGSFRQIETNLISPVADTNLIIDLDPENAVTQSQLAIKGVNDEIVTSFDAYGNATISGTLYANEIESERINAIEDLLAEVESNQSLLNQASEWNTDTATNSADLATYYELHTTNLYVTGQAAISSLFVSDNFTTKNINSLTEALSIQSLASSPLEIMAGKILIDTNGNTKFIGNVEIAGDLKINNIVIANPSTSGEPGLTPEESVTIGEISTNAVAGTATLPAGLTELRIKNEKLKINSLIYVTPVSSTQNKVLYVKSKGINEFTIGFNEAIDTDCEFNWWIIELESI